MAKFKWFRSNSDRYFFEYHLEKNWSSEEFLKGLITQAVSAFYLGNNGNIYKQFIKNERGHTRMWFSYMISASGF